MFLSPLPIFPVEVVEWCINRLERLKLKLYIRLIISILTDFITCFSFLVKKFQIILVFFFLTFPLECQEKNVFEHHSGIPINITIHHSLSLSDIFLHYTYLKFKQQQRDFTANAQNTDV